MTEVRKLLEDVMAVFGILGCGVVSRDGRAVEVILPKNAKSETFSIMAATVFGASVTLHTDAGAPQPTEVIIKAGKIETSISECGKRALVFIIRGDDYDSAKVEEKLKAIRTLFTAP